MTEPRIAILNGRDQVISFLDNSQPDSIHYYDDILHRYLAGSASTFEFKVMSYQDPKEFLQVGNKLSFHHPEMGDFYFNIVTVERGEDETFVSAVGLTFELLNEEVSETKPSTAKSFVQYLDDWGFERERLKIGINEVSDKKIKNEWSGTETILKRLFSLASVFDAELEFVPVLNSDYSLSHLVMNVYRADHGMGQDKRDKTLRYSDGIDSITKTSDISDLITAIRPTGRDGLSLVGLNKPKEEDGCYLSGGDIRSETARDRFPSQVVDTGDGYIMGFWSCDVDSKEMLYGRALAELRKKSVPKLSYDVSGYVEANIGDRVTIEDEQFIPKLFVQCRVVEQEISFTDPSKNKRIFDNFTEIRSEMSSDITAQMEQLIEKYKQYQCSISASNGITFVNGTGQTVLTAIVRDGVADKTSDFEIRWLKDGQALSTGKTITIKSADFGKSCQYGFEIWKDGLKHGQAEVTLTNLKDGADGKAGKDGTDGQNGIDALSIEIDRSYDGDKVTLTAHVFQGVKELNDNQILALGCLKWYKDGTYLGYGKSITRNLTGREAVECRLDNGAAEAKVILLEDGSPASSGRNLLRNADFSLQSTRTNWDTDKNGTKEATYWSGYQSAQKGYNPHLIEFEGEPVISFKADSVADYWQSAVHWVQNLNKTGFPSPILEGITMTLSIDIYRASGSNGPRWRLYYKKLDGTYSQTDRPFKQTAKQGEWVRCTETIKTESGIDPDFGVSLRIYSTPCREGRYGEGEFYIRKPMLTYGEGTEEFSIRPEEIKE